MIDLDKMTFEELQEYCGSLELWELQLLIDIDGVDEVKRMLLDDKV